VISIVFYKSALYSLVFGYKYYVKAYWRILEYKETTLTRRIHGLNENKLHYRIISGAT